ncbi:MAG: cobalamin-binding protein [Betaproteobacteria bacterium]
MKCAHAALVGLAACAMIVCAHPILAEVTVTDDAGTAVTLARPAQRIVSLAPHATELLFVAGAGRQVVGVVAYSDWPREARTLPTVGDATALDLERIVALSPDLVVAWPYTVPGQLAALRARGVAIFVSSPRSIAGIARDVETLGMLAGTDATASAAATSLRARHDALRVKYAAARPISVFYEVWNPPLQTIGGKHLISEAMALCGGINVFGALTLPAPTVSVEAVVAARPEAIIAGSDDGKRPSWLDEWKRWESVPAVRYGNLFVADGDLLHRSGPRFVDGVAAMCGTLDRARANRDRNR